MYLNKCRDENKNVLANNKYSDQRYNERMNKDRALFIEILYFLSLFFR